MTTRLAAPAFHASAPVERSVDVVAVSLFDPTAHEPLTETEWDAARAEEEVAAIVAEAESAGADGVWPNHPIDDDGGDLDEGMTTLYLGAAGMIWALHQLGSSLDLAGPAGDALRRYRERPDWGEWLPGLWFGEAGVLFVATVVGGLDDAGRERIRALAVENERNPTWELMWGSSGTALAAREAGFEDEWRRSAAILVEELERGEGIWTQEISGQRRAVSRARARLRRERACAARLPVRRRPALPDRAGAPRARRLRTGRSSTGRPSRR